MFGMLALMALKYQYSSSMIISFKNNHQLLVKFEFIAVK